MRGSCLPSDGVVFAHEAGAGERREHGNARGKVEGPGQWEQHAKAPTGVPRRGRDTSCPHETDPLTTQHTTGELGAGKEPPVVKARENGCQQER